MGDVQFDDESGEGDTMVVERERDLALSAQARQTIAEIDAALERMADGTYGYSIVSGTPDPPRAPRGDPVGHRARRGEGRRDRPPLGAAWRDRHAMTRRSAPCAARCAIAGIVVLVDQLTKQWASNALSRPQHRPRRTLRFNLALNTGMAFSQGTGLGPIIGVVALLVVVGLLVSIGRSSRARCTRRPSG